MKYDKTKNSIIIIEGPQGTGKTTLANYLREKITYSNLYRLTGIKDKSASGYEKTCQMYKDLLEYMRTLKGVGVNLIFDRHFFSEEVYCRLGYKDYSFHEDYLDFVKQCNNLDFNIFYISLSIEDPGIFEERLKREKPNFQDLKFTVDNSYKQQEVYKQIANELEEYENINVLRFATDDFDQMIEKLSSHIPLLEDYKKPRKSYVERLEEQGIYF